MTWEKLIALADQTINCQAMGRNRMALVMLATSLVSPWLAVEGGREHSPGLIIFAIAVLVTCPFWLQCLDDYIRRNKEPLKEMRAEATNLIVRLVKLSALFALVFVFLIFALRLCANK